MRSILGFAEILKSANLNVNKVPYRDGVQAVSDLGETALAIIRPQIEAGRVKLIVMANQERAPSAPDVQTAIEAGYPNLTFDGLVGLFGLRDVTEDLHSRIAADVQAVASDPAVVKQLEANNQLVRPGNSRDFAAAIDVQRSQVRLLQTVSASKPIDSHPGRFPACRTLTGRDGEDGHSHLTSIPGA